MSSFFGVFLFFQSKKSIIFCYIAGNCFPTVHSLIGHLEITWRLPIFKAPWIWMRACSCCLMLTGTSRRNAKEKFLELINLKWLSIIYTGYDRWCWWQEQSFENRNAIFWLFSVPLMTRWHINWYYYVQKAPEQYPATESVRHRAAWIVDNSTNNL